MKGRGICCSPEFVARDAQVMDRSIRDLWWPSSKIIKSVFYTRPCSGHCVCVAPLSPPAQPSQKAYCFPHVSNATRDVTWQITEAAADSVISAALPMLSLSLSAHTPPRWQWHRLRSTWQAFWGYFAYFSSSFPLPQPCSQFLLKKTPKLKMSYSKAVKVSRNPPEDKRFWSECFPQFAMICLLRHSEFFSLLTS